MVKSFELIEFGISFGLENASQRLIIEARNFSYKFNALDTYAQYVGGGVYKETFTH